MPTCSVCDTQTPHAGRLRCTHEFCQDCFERYLSGSLLELDHELRCCICGERNKLTDESYPDPVVCRFGRDWSPKIKDPTGLTKHPQGDFVIADKASQRILIYDSMGRAIINFAYVYGYTCKEGIAITKDNLIVLSMKNKEYSSLAYYTGNGTFLSFCYLPQKTEVRGLAVTEDNWIVGTDIDSGTIFYVTPEKRFKRTVDLPLMRGEKTPRPYGIAVNSLKQIIVSDEANSCICFFDSNGHFLWKRGKAGQQAGQFCNPTGVAVDSHDRIAVADTGNNRVQLLDDRGRYLSYVVRYTQGPDVYLAPTDVICTASNDVAVLLRGTDDACAGEVRIYAAS